MVVKYQNTARVKLSFGEKSVPIEISLNRKDFNEKANDDAMIAEYYRHKGTQQGEVNNRYTEKGFGMKELNPNNVQEILSLDNAELNTDFSDKTFKGNSGKTYKLQDVGNVYNLQVLTKDNKYTTIKTTNDINEILEGVGQTVLTKYAPKN
jgi:hypothetical protein